MENINIIEILKFGLPGLVLLLSVLSFQLLAKEQGKTSPSSSILKSIKHYSYVNIFLALLTIFAPILDRSMLKPVESEVYSVSAITDGHNLQKGKAAVCLTTAYANRNLLIKDKATQKLIQVYSGSVIPCTSDIHITLAPEDTANLGWESGKVSSDVEIVPAAPGQMFIL